MFADEKFNELFVQKNFPFFFFWLSFFSCTRKI